MGSFAVIENTISQALHSAALGLNDYGEDFYSEDWKCNRLEATGMIQILYPFKEPSVSKLFTVGGKEELDRYLDICLNGTLDNKIGEPGLDYTYHDRIFGRHNNSESRWEKLLRILRNNPSSTRAVITLRNEDEESESDPPCFTLLHFFIRDGELNIVAYFRSWCFDEAASFNIYFIRELLKKASQELGLDVDCGSIVIFAASCHVYEKNSKAFEHQIQRIIKEKNDDISYNFDDYFV